MRDRCRHELGHIFGLARTPEELDRLLEGLLTPQEVEELVKRWRLLRRLLQGEPQRQIAGELGISLGKIARGSRLLQYGPGDFRSLVRRSLAELPDPDAVPPPASAP